MKCCLVLALAAATAAAGTHELSVELQPTFGGAPLVFDQVGFTNAQGQALSVTRLDMLFSDVGLRRKDGSWLALTGRFACVRAREGRSSFALGAVPAHAYEAIRFHVGLPPDVNNADPSIYPAHHPLNPNINGLHWSWLGGYVFLALEGLWNDAAGKDLGYSFHLASDRQLMTVELPLALELDRDTRVQLALDVREILGDVRLSAGQASTHSREDDELAAVLKARAEAAFTFVNLTAAATTAAPESAAMRGTPYRFTFPRTFPMPQLPADNPLSEEGVELGRRLFHEPLLSINDQQSCATCHKESSAFSDPAMRFSLGAEGKPGVRNAMPILNLAWKSAFFWDGRAPSLRDQVKTPIEDPVEMHETVTNVARKLAATDTYPAQFAAVFGSSEITPERIGRALEQFMLTRLSYESKCFCRGYASSVCP
jgi:mono/diheme cytochrome c family protein